MRKNDLSVFKMESEGFKITLKKESGYQPVVHSAPMPAPAPVAPSAVAAPVPAGDSTAKAEKFREITSPMVGTYYAAPAPDAQPYVKAGQEVQEDTVVCIVEAMKVMNEIKAECRGTIVEVVAESGKPVQFGQVLFRLR